LLSRLLVILADWPGHPHQYWRKAVMPRVLANRRQLEVQVVQRVEMRPHN